VTSEEFTALFPEFAASSYEDRIATLLTVLPELDAERAGNQLNMALGNWVAAKLVRQDFIIANGTSAAVGSSTSTEKKVGDVSIKRSTSNTSSSGSSSGGGAASVVDYQGEYDRLIEEFGSGAVAV
jgi:hypothetical protein